MLPLRQGGERTYQRIISGFTGAVAAGTGFYGVYGQCRVSGVFRRAFQAAFSLPFDMKSDQEPSFPASPANTIDQSSTVCSAVSAWAH